MEKNNKKIVENFNTFRNKKENKLNENKSNLTKTQQAISEQLLENTGRALGDSGDAYGRQYDIRAEKGLNFDKLLDVQHDDDGYVDYIAINLPAYLDIHLEKTEESDDLEKEILEKLPDYCGLDYVCSDEINTVLNEIGAEPPYFTESYDEWYNTYNFDGDLNGVLQFTIFSHDGSDYLILETHNGADVRGGYYQGRIYEITEGADMFLLNVQLKISSEDGEDFEGSYFFLENVEKIKYDEENQIFTSEETGKEYNFNV